MHYAAGSEVGASEASHKKDAAKTERKVKRVWLHYAARFSFLKAKPKWVT